MNLWELGESLKAQITNINDSIPSAYRMRLAELGFTEEENVVCIRITPFGAPRLFQIGDSVITIAKDVAQQILVKELK